MNKVIFNKSKIGWFKVNSNTLISNFNSIGLKCTALDEIKYINQYKASSRVNLDLNETYFGISLYDVCVYNICNDLMIFKDELKIDIHQKIILKWFSIARNIIDDFNYRFNKNSYSLVIIINGHSLLDACLLAFAKKLNIQFLCIEATSIDNKIVWDDVSGKVITYNLAKKMYLQFKDIVNEEEYKNYANHFLNTIFKNKRKEHLSNETNNQTPFNKPYVLFLGQVYPDAAQLFSLEGELNNPIKVIENTIQICNELGLPLIIKLHPKEFKGVGPVLARPYNLPTYNRIEHYAADNVYIDFQNEYNTFKLIDNSRIVVTVNSQAGLEACLYDKPVLTYFRSFYSDLGFTYDYQDKKSLGANMSFIIKNNITNNKRFDDSQKFFYIFFEKYCIENSTNSIINKAIKSGSFNKLVKIKFLLYKKLNLLK